MKTIKLSDGNYPALLREIFDPPGILYAEGHVGALAKTCVAVVGTRRCTPYGEAVAFEMGRELARAGVCVVSGLAFGIDAAAHRGALAGGGVTAAVIAQPLQDLMPVKHRALAREIVAGGGVILSEKAAGAECYKVDYLIRNRVISGLSRAVVIVEAGFPSGALNTAKHAGEQGRDVFAVPGRVTDLMSAGCNDLLWKGVGVARSAKDVLDALELVSAVREVVVLEGLEKRLVNLVREEPRHAGELAELCGVSFGELYEALSNLEMRGLVWMAPDQRYAVGGH
jgi:DNA processing protein